MNKFTKVWLALGLVAFSRALCGGKQELEAQYEQNPAIVKIIKRVAADTVTQKIVKKYKNKPDLSDIVSLDRLIYFDYTDGATQIMDELDDTSLDQEGLRYALREEAIKYATTRNEYCSDLNSESTKVVWAPLFNKDNEGILIRLLEKKEYDLVKLLLELGFSPNDNIYVYDSNEKYEGIGYWNMSGGCNVNALSVAIELGCTDIVELFLKKKSIVINEHIFNVAEAKGNDQIKQLLEPYKNQSIQATAEQEKHVQFTDKPHTDFDLSKSKLNENNHPSIKDAHHQTKQQTPPHKSKTSENLHDDSSDSEPSSWLSLKNTLIGGTIITGVVAAVCLVKWLHTKWKMRTTLA